MVWVQLLTEADIRNEALISSLPMAWFTLTLFYQQSEYGDIVRRLFTLRTQQVVSRVVRLAMGLDIHYIFPSTSLASILAIFKFMGLGE